MIVNGEKLAKKIILDIRKEIEKTNKSFGLGVVLVGKNPESLKYVEKKREKCLELGIEFFLFQSKKPDQQEILMQIEEWNKNPRVTGIIVQLPIPKYLDKEKIIGAIDFRKDVDGLTNENAGRLFKGLPGKISATALAVIEILESIKYDLSGKKVAVIGRSNLVSKPLSHLLLARDATVIICHSRTSDLGEITRMADVVISIAGKPGLIIDKMIKSGAVVIDVGITKKGSKIVGDVDLEKVAPIASYITPVPGGVGPLTVAMLMKNVVKGWKTRK